MSGGSVSRTAFLVLALLLSACNGDDLAPSGEDKRQQVVPGSIGYHPSQQAADFTLRDSSGNEFRLSDQLAGADALVLYFTMWCPICLGHSDHMVYAVMPQFQNRGTVRYVLVDYVSGSVSQSRAAESANGYAGSGFVVLADMQQHVFRQFNAAMGSVVVVDSSGVIRLNEDYRNGEHLMDSLDRLLP